MLVEFKAMWFSNGGSYQRDKITSISGLRFKRGIHDVPDHLIPSLPKSAKIVDPDYKAQKEAENVKPEETLRDFDIARDAAVEEAKIQNANAVNDKMEKARAAKAAKKAKLSGKK